MIRLARRAKVRHNLSGADVVSKPEVSQKLNKCFRFASEIGARRSVHGRCIDGGALRRITQERYLRLLDGVILPTRSNELSKLLPA